MGFLLLRPEGIEPTLPVPKTGALSVELRTHDVAGEYDETTAWSMGLLITHHSLSFSGLVVL